MKSIRRILWNTDRESLPIHEQLELKLPSSHLTRNDTELLGMLQRLRQQIAQDQPAQTA